MRLTLRLASFLNLSERRIFQRLEERHRPTLALAVAFQLQYTELGERLNHAGNVLGSAAKELEKLDPQFSAFLAATVKTLDEWMGSDLNKEVMEKRLIEKPVERHIGMTDADYRKEVREHEEYQKEVDANIKTMMERKND